MKGNGIVTNDDIHKHTSNNEEMYFEKVNTELLRRIKEKKEREKATAAEHSAAGKDRNQKKAA